MAIEIDIKSADQVIEEEKMVEDELYPSVVDIENELFNASLAGYIINEFRNNRDSKQSSLIENDIIDSIRAYNGKYSPEDLARIDDEGGSKIFLNITATKARAAKSWILDILSPAGEKPWSLAPTPVAELPSEMKRQIEQSIQQEFEQKKAEMQAPPEALEGMESPEGAPPPPAPEGRTQLAQKTIRETNQSKRDVHDAIIEEIDTEAKFQLRKMENEIHDQLVEGEWDKAMSEFIQDFVVYPTAFMKGPVISRKPRIIYENGEPTVEDTFVYLNKRVNPYDIYPSPDATSINDGNLIEHLRMSEMELSSLRGVPGYDTEKINQILEEDHTGVQWMDSSIENEKAEEEKRGDEFRANRHVIHGLHFFGPVKASLLMDWGVEDEEVRLSDPSDVFEVEAILAVDEVIKVKLNKDPLLRRPYYKASYVEIPGAFWGRSLPDLMSPNQRMCNAAARALANNMGIASGPQVEIYVDRLADDYDITEVFPRKIWQLKSDLSGGQSRAINFFQPDIIADALIKVYEHFELKADDVTGIPKYAYGSDPKMVGSATSPNALSLLLESATKIVKDAIRNIDNGLIKPRIEYQFYRNILDNEVEYSGEAFVVPRGSTTLTIKAAQNLRRNEFINITQNEVDQTIVGPEARADILREIASDLGFDRNLVPSRLDVKRNIQRAAERAKEEQPVDYGLEVAKLQAEMTRQMSEANLQMKQMDLQLKGTVEQMKAQMKQAELESNTRIEMMKLQEKAATSAADREAKTEAQNQEIAVKLTKGTGT